MSLVFLKSKDKQASTEVGRYNPNKPYRFSNYLTQPLKIPPNAQVAYISSQFNIDDNGNFVNEPSYLEIASEGLEMFVMPQILISSNPSSPLLGPWQDVINEYVLSTNEFSMDSDYTGLKYITTNVSGVVQTYPEKGFRMLYDPTTDKVTLKSEVNLPVDQYNLYFNACRSNPDYSSSGWLSGPPNLTGATVPAGINWTDKADSKFHNDIRVRSRNSPSGNTSFLGGNNYGLVVGEISDLNNGRNQVYAGGANWYNTGFSSTALDGNGGIYNWNTPIEPTTDPPMPYDKGRYPLTMTTAGIKKSIGNFTPNNSQQNNRGGHRTQTGIPGEEIGGYAIWTTTNIRTQGAANVHFDSVAAIKEGFTGIPPQWVGVHSLPWIQDYGQKNLGLAGSPYDINAQMDAFLKTVDLNASRETDEPEGAAARYLLGLKIYDDWDGTPGTADLKVQAQILDTLTGSAESSNYINIGNVLSVGQLSNGINTAVPGTPYTFDSSANYSINVANVGAGRTAAMLFFRFRWINKNQMNIEFTLSVDGVATTYNNATDTPYGPSSLPTLPIPPATSSEQRLTNTTTGNIVQLNLNETVNFLDSGGAGGDYSSNENYNMTFVAPEGQTLLMTINDFEFEQSNIAYDRLGIRVSDDGVNWVNISETGFQSMQVEDNPNIPTDPNERIFSVPGQPQNSNDGWIFPTTTTFFTGQLGGDLGKTFNFGAKYMQFRFITDGSGEERGWNLNIFATTSGEYDPRNRWCILASMDTRQVGLVNEPQYYFHGALGDINLVQYPIAATDNTTDFRQCFKGWFNPRQSNRWNLENNNGGGRQPQPYSIQNIFFDNTSKDYLVMPYDPQNPDDAEYTSDILINSGYDGREPEAFTTDGLLDNSINYLGVALRHFRQKFFNIDGLPQFKEDQPDLQVGYQLGFNNLSDPSSIKELTQTSDEIYEITGADDISANNRAFSNHIQITNLPIISQNGVVSSVNKTIYVVDSLCIDNTHDTSSYRTFCDRATFPLWIDLNNLETIEINKIDILITTDENVPQLNLSGDTQVVIQFRDKVSGSIINSIPIKSMPVTRTY